jgi:hypothetical protein
MKNFFKAFRSSTSESASAMADTNTHPASVNSGALTVLELFQSQGCSSCPPANDNVIKLAEDPNFLVLMYDVTYWDHLGWKDTFGNPAFDVRQREYASAMNSRRVFTPQVIVNGRADGVGNREKDLRDIVARGRDGAALDLRIDVAGDSLKLSGDESGGGIVQMVRYSPVLVKVDVTRGENGGRMLPHMNVVRSVKTIGAWTGGEQSFHIPKSESAGNEGLKIAILVQQCSGGQIIGAAYVRLS